MSFKGSSYILGDPTDLLLDIGTSELSLSFIASLSFWPVILVTCLYKCDEGACTGHMFTHRRGLYDLHAFSKFNKSKPLPAVS